MGKASVLALLSEGAEVIATDVRIDLLHELERIFALSEHKHPRARLHTQVLDVTDPVGIRDIVTTFADLDVLFNCAGFVHQGTIAQCDEAQWDHSFNINVRSMYRLIQACTARHACAIKGINYQYGLCLRIGQRVAKSFHLWNDQGGGHRSN